MLGPKVGEIVARVIYAHVTARQPGSFVDCFDMFCKDALDGKEFAVRGPDLITTFVSADAYEKEKVVSKTELAQKLVEAGHLPFTVCFIKSRGAERVLRGRLLEHENLLGRSMVHDFDVKEGHPLREVDHRTIKWLIVNGTKYTLKGS